MNILSIGKNNSAYAKLDITPISERSEGLILYASTKEINGITLYYEYNQALDSRKTLVLIHGFLSSSFSFRRLIPFVERDYNVLSIDFPPFGKSGKSKKFVYSYENIAMTIILLLKQLDLNQVSLVGHSMGGQISLRLASLRSDLVENIVLLGSSAYLKPSKPSLRVSSYLPSFHVIVKKWLEKSGLLHNLQNVVYNQGLIDEEMMRGYMEPFLDDKIFHGLTRMIRDREYDLSSEDLQNIDTPCLLIWGEYDRVVPLAVGRRLQQDLQNSELIVLKDTGHLVPEEQPQLVFEHMNRFFVG